MWTHKYYTKQTDFARTENNSHQLGNINVTYPQSDNSTTQNYPRNNNYCGLSQYQNHNRNLNFNQDLTPRQNVNHNNHQKYSVNLYQNLNFNQNLHRNGYQNNLQNTQNQNYDSKSSQKLQPGSSGPRNVYKYTSVIKYNAW